MRLADFPLLPPPHAPAGQTLVLAVQRQVPATVREREQEGGEDVSQDEGYQTIVPRKTRVGTNFEATGYPLFVIFRKSRERMLTS